jgi:MFS transporter, MHS family, shikimate and dehydroshikimate transport protein
MARPKQSSIRMVGLASLIGTTIEWYDFFLYGTAAALVLDKVFFPTFDPFVGRLASLTTYAVGFIARPLGGIIIGHFGDRIGRKSMLVLTLMIMGIATFLIGVLPTYNQVGPIAAVLLVLLRVAQGFGVGGEWGGAILMAVEHAPPGKRGFYGSWPQIGVPAGLLLSTLVFTPFSRLPQDSFLTWGWRVPFLISLVLVFVGLIIRVRIIETPAFARMKEQRQEAQQPIFEVLRHYPREVLVAMGARLAENGAFYLYTVFVLIYGTQHVGMDRNIVLTGIMIAAALELFAIPLYGALSDICGPKTCVSLRGHHDSSNSLSALLDDGLRFSMACPAGLSARPYSGTRRDVRTARSVLFRIVWSAGSL